MKSLDIVIQHLNDAFDAACYLACYGNGKQNKDIGERVANIIKDAIDKVSRYHGQ